MSLRRSAAVILANCRTCGGSLSDTSLRTVSASLQNCYLTQRFHSANAPTSASSDRASLHISQGYLEEVRQLQTKIFGTYFGNGLRSGRKVLQKPLIGDKIASWYTPGRLDGKEPWHFDPLWVDPTVER